MAYTSNAKFLTDILYTEQQFAQAHQQAIEKPIPVVLTETLGADGTLETGNFGALCGGYFIEFVGNETYNIPLNSTKLLEVGYESITKVITLNLVDTPSVEGVSQFYNQVIKITNFDGYLTVTENKFDKINDVTLENLQRRIANFVEVDKISIPGSQILKVLMHQNIYRDEDRYIINCKMKDLQDMENTITTPTFVGIYSRDGLTELLAPVNYDGTFRGDNVEFELVRNLAEDNFKVRGAIVAFGTTTGGIGTSIVDIPMNGRDHEFLVIDSTIVQPVNIRFGTTSSKRTLKSFDSSIIDSPGAIGLTVPTAVDATFNCSLKIKGHLTILKGYVESITGTLPQDAANVRIDLEKTSGADRIELANDEYLLESFSWILIEF